MLLVQKYLETHTFGQLAAEHGVYASFCKSGHKWSLNYDQIEARESDPLAQECRGLILSRENGQSLSSQATEINGKLNYDLISPGKTIILAFPMKRFFNLGQGACADVNWNDPNLSILEKLDGSLLICYFDPFTNQWNVATRAVSEADLPMDNEIFTFRTLFEKSLFETSGKTFDEFTVLLNKEITYCFELTSPYNRIVVRYDDCRITLLAARDLSNLQEIDISTLNQLGVPIVKSYKYFSVEELTLWVSSRSPMEHEGVVVRDGSFNRIKVKNAQYVAYNKIRDTLATSSRNCLELILGGTEDDVLPFLPEEIGKNLISIKEKYKNWISNEEQMYSKVFKEASEILPNDKKTFALAVNKYPTIFKPAYFAIFDNKAISIKDFIVKNRKGGTWSDSFLDKISSML